VTVQDPAVQMQLSAGKFSDATVNAQRLVLVAWDKLERGGLG